jgi:ornithine cyclodeaminase
MIQALSRILSEPWEDLTLPPRTHLSLPNSGTWLIMPAADRELAITKLVTVHPHNRQQGRPSVQGDVIVCDAASGRRLLWLDGERVTAIRTAALSILAAQRLANNPGGDWLVVGTGVQAAAHIAAAVHHLGTKRVYVAGRNLSQAERFCRERQRDRGFESVELRPILDVATAGADLAVLVTATTSQIPVVPQDLPTGLFIAAVGAYRRDHREIPEAVVARAAQPTGLLVVDTEAAAVESGELAAGDWDRSRIVSLRHAWQLPRAPRDLVLFKSVGHAAWDLAAARVAVRQLSPGSPSQVASS